MGKTYEEYLATREAVGDKKPVTLMDIATVAVKYLKKNGTPRKSAFDLDDDFLQLIQDAYKGEKASFMFKGFEEVTNGFFTCFYPIYELIVNGLSYEYFHICGKDYNADIGYIERDSIRYGLTCSYFGGF